MALKKINLLFIFCCFAFFVLSGQNQKSFDISVSDVSVNITSCCSNSLGDSVNRVTLESLETDSIYQASFGASQSVTFESIPNGKYNLKVEVKGHQTFMHPSIDIEQNYSEDVMVFIPVFPPANLLLDTVTSILCWDKPLFAPLEESFINSTFPPDSWNSETQGIGWQLSDNGSSEGFPVPNNGGFYAFVNNDNAEPGNNGCCDLLTTSSINLRYRDSFTLGFDSFFTAKAGQTALVNYSTNGGQTWNLLSEMEASTEWQSIEIDLSFLSGFEGEENVLFQFETSDNGQQGSGWAIDNVLVSAGNFNAEYYVLELGTSSYEIDFDSTTFFIPNLMYGTEYIYKLGSYACCIISSSEYKSFTSGYLPVPENFQINFDENTNELYVEWTVPVLLSNVPEGLTGFTLEMDGNTLSEVPYQGESAGETIIQTIFGFSPGEHEFCVSAIYDLTPYGFSGIIESSLQNCASITIIYTETIEDIKAALSVKMYPNPTTNKLTIESADKIETVSVVNLLGQSVLVKEVGLKQVVLNTSVLENGIYLLRVKTEYGIMNKKIVVEN